MIGIKEIPMNQDDEIRGSGIVTSQSIFNETKCYDLMPNSRKGIVFDTLISFQLAFFALIEHGYIILYLLIIIIIFLFNHNTYLFLYIW